MSSIEYGKPEWNEDTEAANAEARRRAILTRDAEDPADREAIWFSDLGALTVLPEELEDIAGLKRLIVGDAATPDGRLRNPSQKVDDTGPLARLTALTELNIADSGILDLSILTGLGSL